MKARSNTSPARLGSQVPWLAVTVLLLASLGCGSAAALAPSVAPTAKPSSSAAAPASSAGVPSSAAASAVPSGQGRQVVFGVPSSDITAFAVLLTLDQGLYAQRGLNVSIQAMESATIVAALNSGEVQFTNSTGSATRAAVQGLPVRIIAYIQRYEPFSLVAKNDFKTVADLKGKRVAIPQVGGDNYDYTLAALSQGGLKVTDIQPFPLTLPAQVAQALLAGNIDAGVLSPPLTQDMSEKGFHPITGPNLIELPSNGLGTSQQVLQKDPNLVKTVLDATLDGITWAKAHPQEASDYFAKKFSLSPSIAKAAFQQQMDVLGFSFSDQVLQDSIDRALAAAKSDKKVTVSDVYDFATFRQLVVAKKLQ